ncbi:hypothetical protein Hanom_Chr16g01456091 [Helianthus anomalus]
MTNVTGSFAIWVRRLRRFLRLTEPFSHDPYFVIYLQKPKVTNYLSHLYTVPIPPLPRLRSWHISSSHGHNFGAEKDGRLVVSLLVVVIPLVEGEGVVLIANYVAMMAITQAPVQIWPPMRTSRLTPLLT